MSSLDFSKTNLKRDYLTLTVKYYYFNHSRVTTHEIIETYKKHIIGQRYTCCKIKN